MRILVCAEEAPIPPATGFRVAVGSLVERLRERHEVRVLAYRGRDQAGRPEPDGMRLVDPPASGTAGDALLAVRAGLRRRPLRVDAYAAGLHGALLEELEAFRPDVVHVTSGRLAALGRTLAGRPAVLGAFDAAHLNVAARAHRARGLRRRLLSGEVKRWRRYEATDWHRFSRVTVSSAEDRDALAALDRRMRIDVIPLGLDVEAYAAPSTLARARDRIVFHGVMEYAPNVTAAEFLARRVFPRVREAHPEARLFIVGRDPTPAVRALGALPGVDVTGAVPDVRPWLASSRAFACTMRSATGAKTKVLEAMASGLPCVVTPLAARGLAAVPGRDLLVGGDVRTLAEHLAGVLADDALAERLGGAARRFARAEHDWRTIATAYERLYEAVAQTDGAPAGERR